MLRAGHAVALARPDALAEQLLSYLDASHVTVRRAVADDASAIGAVFDAAVADGWGPQSTSSRISRARWAT